MGRGHRLLLLLILLLGLGLRLYRLDAQSFWNDEGNAARAAERSVPLILDAAGGDIHPPGYYLLLHFWRAAAGESEFALRSLSAFCGLLTVACTFRLGRDLLGRRVGLVAAFLSGISPFAIYYAQEARMYALLGLASAASTCFLIRLVGRGQWRGEPTGRPCSLPTGEAAGYILTAAVGLYTHYAFPFVLAAHNLLFAAWWLLRQRRAPGGGRTLLRWAALQAAALLLFLPWLPRALHAVAVWPSAGGGYALGPALLDIFRVLTVGSTLELPPARPALLLAGLLLLVGLWPRRGEAAVAALAAWLLLPVALIFAFDLYKAAYLKFLLAVLPPFHLLLAQGAERLSQPVSRLRPALASPVLVVWPLLMAVLLWPSLNNLYDNPAYARDDYRQIAADIAAQALPGDAVLLDAPNQWEVFTYYHRTGAPVYPIPRGSRPPRPEAVAAELEGIAARHRRLFVLYWGQAEADPQWLIEGWLAAHAYPAGDRWYGRVRLAVYGLGPLPAEPEVRTEARFGEDIHLQGYAMGAGPFMPGEVVPVTLFWETDAPLTERYKVFLHLLDSGGRLAAQTDSEPGGGLTLTTMWPAGERLADRHGVLLPSDLPPGEYSLIAGLYHLVTGARLPVAVAGQAAGDHITLGSVSVGQ